MFAMFRTTPVADASVLPANQQTLGGFMDTEISKRRKAKQDILAGRVPQVVEAATPTTEMPHGLTTGHNHTSRDTVNITTVHADKTVAFENVQAQRGGSVMDHAAAPTFVMTKDAVRPSELNDFFAKAFASIERQLPFNPAWHGSTGYFEGAFEPAEHGMKMTWVNRLDMDGYMYPGEMATSMDEKGRRLIFIGSRLGIVVVFDRFEGEPGVYACNTTREVIQSRMLDLPGQVTLDTMHRIIGEPGISLKNFGKAVEYIYDTASENTMTRQ